MWLCCFTNSISLHLIYHVMFPWSSTCDMCCKSHAANKTHIWSIVHTPVCWSSNHHIEHREASVSFWSRVTLLKWNRRHCLGLQTETRVQTVSKRYFSVNGIFKERCLETGSYSGADYKNSAAVYSFEKVFRLSVHLLFNSLPFESLLTLTVVSLFGPERCLSYFRPAHRTKRLSVHWKLATVVCACGKTHKLFWWSSKHDFIDI